MNLTFQLPSLEYMVARTAAFQSEGTSNFFQESLYLFYPQFSREHMASLDPAGRSSYIYEIFSALYQSELPVLEEKLFAYQAEWDQNRPVIQSAFEQLFSLELDGMLNNMNANITLNPVCPRFLDTSCFDIFYLNSPAGALGLSLHEMVHFLWFHVWQTLFQDDPAEYENPHLKWVFSEMVVDLFLNDPNLHPLNPYLTKGSGTIYEYFHRMTISGQPALKRIGSLYQPGQIQHFMKAGFALCQQYEAELRAAMC